MTGRRRLFCCGSMASLRHDNCKHLPIQTLLPLPTTIISAAAAAGTTIAVAVLAGRLFVMSFSRNFSACSAAV
jgi:hypothetical protein